MAKELIGADYLMGSSTLLFLLPPLHLHFFLFPFSFPLHLSIHHTYQCLSRLNKPEDPQYGAISIQKKIGP